MGYNICYLFSGAKIQKVFHIRKRERARALFLLYFRQFLHLRKPKSKAAEAALNFSLVKKMFPQYGVKFSFFFVHKLNEGNEFLFFKLSDTIHQLF